jgi:hypothetical protein
MAEAGGSLLEQVSLHQWAVEIMSGLTIIGGGAIVLWTRFQKARLDMAKQWYEFQAPSLQEELKKSTAALQDAQKSILELKDAAENAKHSRDESMERNNELAAIVASMSKRIEEMTQHMSNTACPFSKEGHARCGGHDAPVPANPAHAGTPEEAKK